MRHIFKKDRIYEKRTKLCSKSVDIVFHNNIINFGIGLVIQKEWDGYRFMSFRLNIPFISLEIDKS